jgi:hypothetical protein
MTRQELIVWLAQMVVQLPYKGVATGIILPQFADIKTFRQEFDMLMNTVPDFLMPKVHYSTLRQYDFGNSSHIWLSDTNSGKGRTFNSLYLSSRLTDEDKKKHLFCFLPMIGSINNIHTFEDM